MKELSLNILDITENSLTANATWVQISVEISQNTLTIEIVDDGCGMSEELLASVCDPYTTTRTTRAVGMGIPLLKMQAELSNGSFEIRSQKDVGTTVKATFELDHIDRPPLGDVGESVMTLLAELGQTRLSLAYRAFEQEFCFDTNQLRDQLGDLPIDTPQVLIFVKQLIQENITTINGGMQI